MNISDVIAALHEQAEEMDELMTPQLPHVQARVHRARRRRAAVVAAAVGAAAVAAAAVLVVVLPRGEARPEPAAPPEPADPVSVAFPQHVGRYHLVATRVGVPGDGRIALNLATRSHRFAIQPVCRGPEPTLDTHLVVNGTSVGGASCLPTAPTALPGAPVPGFNEHDLRTSGIRTRRPLTISLTLLRGRFDQVPTTQPDTVLGLAVYERDH